MPPSLTRRARWLGQRGEQLAAEYLQAQGYTILARNWRCPSGEIDIVARHGDILVFVEVRARRAARYGTPEESITPRKRSKLVAAAYTYLQEAELTESNWRIDVVAIELASDGAVRRLNVVQYAI